MPFYAYTPSFMQVLQLGEEISGINLQLVKQLLVLVLP